ncbi:MAG: bifunctional riboflavin kinase/FAD synthetase [Bacteroidia bacterium]
MKVIYDISLFSSKKPIVLTQGTFDGVHFGHKKILSQVVSEAKKMKGESVLLTFYPHPRLVLNPDKNDLKLLSTIEEKTELVADLGIDYLIIIPFTQEFSQLSASAFVKIILVDKIHIAKLIIGYDHRFGRGREGGIEQMKELAELHHFQLAEIPAQDISESIVSSTKIRQALLIGDVQLANQYLGTRYVISGKVEEGHQRGRTLGFPTANIRLDSSFKLVPLNGVYAVWVCIDKKKYPGMLNIGYNPTFEENKWSLEVHVFDFSENVYNKQISVEFVARHRSEQKFDSPDSLIKALRMDEKKIREILQA